MASRLKLLRDVREPLPAYDWSRNQSRIIRARRAWQPLFIEDSDRERVLRARLDIGALSSSVAEPDWPGSGSGHLLVAVV